MPWIQPYCLRHQIDVLFLLQMRFLQKHLQRHPIEIKTMGIWCNYLRLKININLENWLHRWISVLWFNNIILKIHNLIIITNQQVLSKTSELWEKETNLSIKAKPAETNKIAMVWFKGLWTHLQSNNSMEERRWAQESSLRKRLFQSVVTTAWLTIG